MQAEQAIPENAKILVFLTPQSDISVEEQLLLSDYFKNGGHSIFLFDILEKETSLKRLEEVLSEFNIRVNDDLISENDANQHFKNKPNDLLPNVLSNEINGEYNSSNGFTIPVFSSRSVTVLDNQKDWITSYILAETSENAFAQPLDTKEEVKKGKQSVAVAVDNQGGYGSSKILVSGDSDFIKDTIIDNVSPYGIQFIFNTLIWMYAPRNEIYIPEKQYEVARLTTLTEASATIIALVVIIVLPLLILGAGIFVWLRRRHL